MEHDVFISHAYKDQSIADAICEKLESARLTCWIPVRDVSAGEDWTEATRNAIESSRVMVLVLSENANAAHHIEREIAHAFYTQRTIIPFRVADTFPRRNFLFYIGNVPWLNAASPPAEEHLEALTARIRVLVTDRTVTSKAGLPRSVTQTTATLDYQESWKGPLRAFQYRPLKILKWVGIATYTLAAAFLLWFALRQAIEGSSRGQFSGSWRGAVASPTPLLQHALPDMSPNTPAEPSAGLISLPRADATPEQRAGLTSISESPGPPLPSPEMHQTPHRHHQSRRPKAQEVQRSADFAKGERDGLQNQLEEAEAKARAAQNNADLAMSQRAALEAQLSEVKQRAQLAEVHANLAVTQRDALKAELAKAEEKAQLAQHNADFAVRQLSLLETQLSKAQEEKARLAQQRDDLANLHNSAPDTQYQKEDAQPANQHANLAANQLDSARTQPPNPGQNATPAPLTQTLDSSAQFGGH
jgi:TIR domain